MARLIKSNILVLINAFLFGANPMLFGKANDSSLISIKPVLYGFYGISAYNQLDSRFSNGQANMFLGSQGKSGHVITPNLLVGAELNINPFRSGFYALIGAETGTLKTRIEFQHPSISVSSRYPTVSYNMKRKALMFGIGTANIESKYLGKSIKFEFSLSYVLQMINIKNSNYVSVNGNKVRDGSGIVLVDEKNKSDDIKFYNNLYYFTDNQNEINFYFGLRKAIKRIVLGAGLNYRVSMKNAGILYTEYYPGNQLLPSVQMNDVHGTGVGLKMFISIPIL
jgi:hypothetical protein